jgi:hypothetical protein
MPVRPIAIDLIAQFMILSVLAVLAPIAISRRLGKSHNGVGGRPLLPAFAGAMCRRRHPVLSRP